MRATGDYWNRPDVVTTFATASPPGYLADIVPQGGPGAVALDVGCGGGRNLPLLAERGYRVVGIDLHAEMVLRARGVAAGVAFCRADVAALPVATARAAVVVCHGVLHNLPRPEQVCAAIGELSRVVATAGVVSLNLFSAAHLDHRLTRLADDRHRLPNGQVMTLLPPERIAALCRAAGFEFVDGPFEYLHDADPGQRSVWRAVLRPTGTR
ncbi:class I SAM-dependent methyltransferase [Micromonospora echinofusca]|uniref:class I SAM-dependent methyltransferase n=1 Tax=Micromonospora echinofusca TaxID=47858 RepID=UPI00332BC52C